MNAAAADEMMAAGLDAVVVKGDLSTDGTPEEFAAFEACYRDRFGEDMSPAALAGFSAGWALFADVLPHATSLSPADVADGAYVAAGSALTGDVEPGQIAVARGRQKNVDGWVARARAGTPTAAAAQAATDAGTRHTPASDSATTDEEKA